MIWDHKAADLQTVHNDLIPLLQSLIQNRCVNTGDPQSGNESKNAKRLACFLKEGGIPSVFWSALPHRESLLAEVKGSAASPQIIGLMGHLDVVPAEENRWSTDPFAAHCDGQWLVGRGAVDMLGQVAVMATALRALISEKGTPKQTVRFMAFADEEADGVLGAQQWVQTQLDSCWAVGGSKAADGSRIADGTTAPSSAAMESASGAGSPDRESIRPFACDVIFTELGGYFLDPTHIAVAVAEKGLLRIQLVASGTAGHGSMPYRADNAALKICEAVHRIQQASLQPNYTPEAMQMINAMTFPKDLKGKLLNPATVGAALEAIANQTPGVAKLLHSALFLTVSLGVLEGGTKVNVIPDSAQAQYDVRIQPGQSRESVLNWFDAVLNGLGIRVYEREYCPANASSVDSPYFAEIQKQAAAYYPQATLVPVVAAGVTDGRFFRPLGTPVFGFSLFSPLYTYDFFSKGLHGVDEKIDVESLALGFSFYRRLLESLLY